MGNISCVSTKDAEKDKVNSVASFSCNTFWKLLSGLVCFLFFVFIFVVVVVFGLLVSLPFDLCPHKPPGFSNVTSSC